MQGNHQDFKNTAYGPKFLPELQRTVWGGQLLAMARSEIGESPKRTVVLIWGSDKFVQDFCGSCAPGQVLRII